METQTSGIPVRLRVRKAAAKYGLSATMLRAAVREGRLEAYKVGNRYEVTEQGIAQFLEGTRVPRAPRSSESVGVQPQAA